MKNWKLLYFFLISLGVIVVDQIVKVIVHLNMEQGEFFGWSWLKIYYTVNPGMAFGIEFGGDSGKIFLTLFRIVAMFAIAWYIRKLYREGSHRGLLLCIAFILGGAIGNLVDSVFYAVIFPDGGLLVEGATTPWFHGMVVDMFYIDIAQGHYPDWVPGLGGQYYSFWPIFNIADAAIFCAVGVILFRQKKFFLQKGQAEQSTDLESESTADNPAS